MGKRGREREREREREGTAQRLLSTLLNEMDGIDKNKRESVCEREKGGYCLVIGATNRPEEIDDALLR